MHTSSNNENHLVLLKVTVNDLQNPRSTEITCFLNLPLFDVYHLILFTNVHTIITACMLPSRWVFMQEICGLDLCLGGRSF